MSTFYLEYMRSKYFGYIFTEIECISTINFICSFFILKIFIIIILKSIYSFWAMSLETMSHYIALTGLELSMQIRLALDSPVQASLPKTGFEGVTMPGYQLGIYYSYSDGQRHSCYSYFTVILNIWGTSKNIHQTKNSQHNCWCWNGYLWEFFIIYQWGITKWKCSSFLGI